MPIARWELDDTTGSLRFAGDATTLFAPGALPRDLAAWRAQVDPRDRAGFDAHLAALRRGEPSELELRIGSEAGPPRWLRSSGPGTGALAGVLVAIDPPRAGPSLEALVEVTPLALLVVAHDDDRVLASPRLRAMFELPPAPLTLADLSARLTAAAGHGAGVDAPARWLRDPGPGEADLDLRDRRRLRRRSASIVRDGAPVAHVHGFEDVTEARDLEQRARDLVADVRHAAASDLHDGAGQGLTAAAMLTSTFADERGGAVADLAASIEDATITLRQVMASLSTRLDGDDAPASLEALALELERAGIPCEVVSEVDLSVTSHLETVQIVRLVEDALELVVRRGGARRAQVLLRERGTGRVLRVIGEDGRDAELPAEHGGLERLLHVRARLLSGVLQVRRESPTRRVVSCYWKRK